MNINHKFNAESACPIIMTREYGWDQLTDPYTRNPNVDNPFENTSIYGQWMTPNGYPSMREDIWTATGVRNDNDLKGRNSVFKPCLHTVETNSFSAPEIKHVYPRGSGGNAYARGCDAQLVQTALDLRLPPDIDWQAYADQAYAFMVPRLNEGLSLVNSLLELKDVKQMNPVPSYLRLKYRKYDLKALKDPRTRKQFSKELFNRMNGAYLNANLGIKPLINDCYQIYSDLMSFAERLRVLKLNAGRRLVRHYRRTLPSPLGGPETTVPLSYLDSRQWSGDLAHDRVTGDRAPITFKCWGRWVQRPVYHATMRYSYSLPLLDSYYEESLAKLDVLGVRLDPAIVWNAIPYSFIVDWVVDVSGFLSSFAKDNYPINVVVHDFCHSLACESEHEVTAYYPVMDPNLVANPHYASSYVPLDDPIQVYYGSRRLYDRRLATPNTHAIATRGPKLRQAALAGSLLLSKFRRINSRRYTHLDSVLILRPKKKK